MSQRRAHGVDEQQEPLRQPGQNLIMTTTCVNRLDIRTELMQAYHYTSRDTVGLNEPRGEHRQRLRLEGRIGVVGIAIARSHPVLDRQEETRNLHLSGDRLSYSVL